MRYALVFDEVMISQLKKLGTKKDVRSRLSKMFDKMEAKGPKAGELIDTQLFLYEVKAKDPPIRLYFKHVKETNELYVFKYEMKTSEKKQKQTIANVNYHGLKPVASRLRRSGLVVFASVCLGLR